VFAVREIVIIPAWQRPEFLQATLERLRAADEGTQEFWLSLDRRHSKAVAMVATDFRRVVGDRAKILTRTHGYRGNSFNVLHSYLEASRHKPDLIHLVEEDVFVSDDYFAWHRATHDLVGNAFAVSGARNQNYRDDPEPQPGVVYLNGAYQSVAVSFRTEQLTPVLAHVARSNNYYRDPVKYCRTLFPQTRIPHGNAEQDGLINRVVEKLGAFVVYPTEPVAYHAGFVGYHRAGDSPLRTGVPVQVAAQALLGMDAAEMNRRAHSYPDHQVVDVHAPHRPPNRVTGWPVLP
jgi:hypothetical protein